MGKSLIEFNANIRRYFTYLRYREYSEYISGPLKGPLCTNILTDTVEYVFLSLRTFFLFKERKYLRPAKRQGSNSTSSRRTGRPARRLVKKNEHWDQEH